MTIDEHPTSSRTLWVTGAGSGMGRAVAIAAARMGYRVALSGRREDALAETAAMIEAQGGVCTTVTMDATRQEDIRRAHRHINATLGPVTHLVLSAGLNAPKRYWRDQSMSEFNAIVQTNLTAAAAVTDAVLPEMRDAGSGVVVFISSYSGWEFSPDAGVAYSASKTALSSLSASLNAQENVNGIRACNLCPGDVDTDFLGMRPLVPDHTARQSMLGPDDIAAAVQFVLDSPEYVCINELVISPTKKALKE